MRIRAALHEIYHVYNRGTDKRVVFQDEADYLRFVRGLRVFNDVSPAANAWYHLLHSDVNDGIQPKRKELVEIFAFCLMPNHFHIMVREKVEDGLPLFMRKLGTGYTNYFNNKYSRSGVLFQGKYKLTRVERDAHFLWLPFYIHLNPLDLMEKKWKCNKALDTKKALEFLRVYRWSSFGDYVGKDNYPELLSKELLVEMAGGPEDVEKKAVFWMENLLKSDFDK